MTISRNPTVSRRLRSFWRRFRWMVALSRSPLRSSGLIVRFLWVKGTVAVLRTPYGRVSFRRQDELALEEVLHNQEYHFLSRQLERADAPCVLDVGAHIGTFALWALNRNPHANIFSVEADPKTYEILLTNMLRTRKAGLSWRTLNAAAGAHDNRTLRFGTDGHSMSHRITDEGDVEVTSVSLARLINEHADRNDRIDILKIDIEGGEAALLQDAEALLQRVDTLVIELHPKLCDTRPIVALLECYFAQIKDMHEAADEKPLLFCSQNRHRTSGATA